MAKSPLELPIAKLSLKKINLAFGKLSRDLRKTGLAHTCAASHKVNSSQSHDFDFISYKNKSKS